MIDSSLTIGNESSKSPKRFSPPALTITSFIKDLFPALIYGEFQIS